MRRLLSSIAILFAFCAQLAQEGKVLGQTAAAAEAIEPADGNPRTVYFSTGDNQDYLGGSPLDSLATIEATFETLDKGYKVSRIWWRGGQDEVWGKQFVFRPENREFARLWQWWKHLAYEGVGTNRLAVKAAHDRGMEIWLTTGLFDNGSRADVGYSGFPFVCEDKIRVEHPEWIPVNKYGTWRQGGPIEFCYPGARKAMADYLTKFTVDGGYDGLALLTYAENFSQRYEDEFGYNQPIVDEFKKRYGVDIRTQSFDKAAWSKLRGEYLTQFLRELHVGLARQGKKLAVCVDGKQPHLPSVWGNQMRTAGTIYCDLETWAKEKLADEINVWVGATDKSVRQCAASCKGTATKVSAFATRGDLPRGMPRIMWLGTDVERGFDWENYINQADEKIPQQPEDALQAKDPFSRRRLVTSVAKGKQKLPVAAVIEALKDKDVFVRRSALRALGKMKDAAAIPAVAAALLDAENSVRWQAALVLEELDDPKIVERLFAIVARDDSTFQFNFRAVVEALGKQKKKGKLGPEAMKFIVSQIAGTNSKAREVALYVCLRVGAPGTTSGLEMALLDVIKKDKNSAVRELALRNLASSYGPTPTVINAVTEATRDADAVLQMRAALVSASLRASLQTKEARAQALDELRIFFHRYGDGCRRSDAEWGWREVGDSIVRMGPEGKAVLEAIMKEKKDRRLAELAWRLVYLRQGEEFNRITEKEDAAAHAHHPFL